MKKTIKIPSQIKLQTEFFEGYGMTELIKSIIVLVISSWLYIIKKKMSQLLKIDSYLIKRMK